MERFVCGSGVEDLHNQPDPALLRELGVETPEQLHLDGAMVLRVARGLTRGGWVPIPFCNTLCSEGLGAKPCLSMEGARVKEPPYARVEELPAAFSPDFPRMTAMLAAMDALREEGLPVAYSIEGPFTLLSSLIPMSRMFATLRKPAGAALLAQAEEWVSQYAALAVAHGARLLSYADPVATVDILGEKVFNESYLPCCQRVLERLGREQPGTVIHLCGKLTQSLLDTENCTVTRWEPEAPCESYGQTLLAYCAAHPEGGLVGHFCLNLLHAKRPWISQVKITERKTV